MIEVRLEGYRASPGKISLGTAGSHGIESIRFIRGEGWETALIKATFNTTSGKSVDVVADDSDTMNVPAEATEEAGKGTIVLTGSAASGAVRISADIVYSMMKHSNNNGEAPGEVTPTLVEQLAAKVAGWQKGVEEATGEARDAAEEIIQRADRGDFDGKVGPSGVYVGTSQPAEPEIQIWVDPTGDAAPPLTFTGAVQAKYDGSQPVTVNIPQGGGGSYDDTELRGRIGALETGFTYFGEYAAPIIADGIRPEHYGAKGDGTTDDTAAIQAAMDAGKCVVFSASKVYRVTAPLRLRAGLSLIGANLNQRVWGHTVIKNENSDLFDYRFEDGSTIIDNVTIRGISFQGDDALSHVVFRPGLSNSHSWTVSHCGFERWDSIFPYDEGIGMTHWYMHDIACVRVNSIGRVNGADHTFFRWNAGDYGNRNRDYLIIIRTVISRFQNMFFTGKLKGAYGADAIMYINGSGTVKGNVIDGCWFDYCDKHGINISNGAHDNIISNCSFRGIGRTAETGNQYRDIQINTGCNRNIVTGCSFLRTHTGEQVPDKAQRFYIHPNTTGNIVADNMYEIPLKYLVSDKSVGNTVREPSEGVLIGGDLNWRTGVSYINFLSTARTIPANGELSVDVGAAPYSSAVVVANLQKEYSPLPDGISIARAYISGGYTKIVFANSTAEAITINDERKGFNLNYATAIPGIQ